MRWPLGLLLGLTCLPVASGCRNCDLVEAELRTKERELRELRSELVRTEACNEALEREIRAVRLTDSAKITPELASQTYTLKQIVLGRQTSGYDDDGAPGDEALEVFIEPRDADGHPIKAPGSVHIEALAISPEGVKTPLSSWDVGPEQLRRSWRSGLLSTGYDLILPWKAWPTTEKLRVTAQFTLSDGRLFEADKDITIRLPGPLKSSKPTSPPPGTFEVPAAPVPVPPEKLPNPHKLETTPFEVPSSAPQLPAKEASGINPAGHWQTEKPTAPVHEAIRLLRPQPLAVESGP